MARISKKSSELHCQHNWQKFFSIPKCTLEKCTNCGLIRTVSKKKTLNEYSETDIEEAVKLYWLRGEEWRAFSRKFIDNLPTKKGRLLDIGCGSGYVVAEANRRGLIATGIDPSKGMIYFGKKRIDPNLIAIPLEKYHPKDKFDYVTMNHVLEHITELSTCLKQIKSLLKYNGKLMVACPNINSLTFRIFQERWYPLSPWEHIWQFTPETLEMVIKNEGYTIKKRVVNSMSYNPKNPIKKLAFIILTTLANISGYGDQIIIVAQKDEK